MRSDIEITEEMIDLLNKKKRLFLEFEDVAEQMMTDSADEIDNMIDCTERRELLKDRIDELDRQLSEIAGCSEDGTALLQASKNKCDFSDLKEEHQAIFRTGQEIFGIISRIQDLDLQITKNMDSMMGELQERIKQNKKNTKFTGYINNMGLQASKGVLYDKKR